uniref:DNA-directed DNA polymerase n=1 Tax=viral metagenome TaxID=1070528 RepID=A0A6C0HV03_9ZZZZ
MTMNRPSETQPASTATHQKKIHRKIKGKSVRLLDFHVYDECPTVSPMSTDQSSSDDETVNVSNKPHTVPKFIIQMYGINEQGETFSIFVQEFQPFFFVSVADHWTQNNCNQLRTELLTKLGGGKRAEQLLLGVELVKYNKLYGFSAGKQSKFAQLTFQNSMTMMRVRNMWYVTEPPKNEGDIPIRKLRPLYSQKCKLELYESKLPPLLRYFHIYNISPSGWVFVPQHTMIDSEKTTTSCHYEFRCSMRDLIPQSQKETRVPYKICSFDIEASSSHGDFPIPKKTYKRLATQLVDIFQQQIKQGNCDKSRQNVLIERIILAAFGYGKFSDIDLVYPKGKTPSRKYLEETLIPRWIAHICMDSEGNRIMNTDTKNLQSIERMFEKILPDEDGDKDEEDVCDDEVDMVEEEDEDDHLPNVISKKTPLAPSKRIVAGIELLDMLQQDKYSREEKITMVNEAFCFPEHGFPELEGDKVTFIGSTFMKYGDNEPYLNHCLVLNTCDPVPGAVIETVSNEDDLLKQWTQLIQTENPDIIIGYNIFGFDYQFMFVRAQETGCIHEFLQLSRKYEQEDTNQRDDKIISPPKLDNTKIVLATGEYDLRYPSMPGRLQIDMYTYFRRDFNLASYKLDDVAGQFIRDDVKKVEFVTDSDGATFTYLYTNNIAGLHVGDYIHIEISSFTSDYYRDGHKFIVLEILPSTDPVSKYIVSIEGHETDLHDQKKSIKWCMAKDDVSPQDIFRLSNGDAKDRAKVAKYCIQDCNLVHHLMNKIDVITGYVEMARICSVPISFLVFRGQGIKLTSYVSKKCREKKTLMPDLEKPEFADGYEGAIVLPPKCSMYMDNPVACLDYASLYPSSMISNNLSPDSKVWTKEYDLKGTLIRQTGDPNYDNLEHLGYKYIDVEFDTFQWRKNPEKPSAQAVKQKTGKKICRWVQLPNHQKSIMPAILEELLQARANTRKLIKTEKDPFMQNILDKRQLGYKVTANSLYGQCGARTSTFYEKDVAASTTATGRQMITYAKRIIEEVYGDMEFTTETQGTVKCCAEYVYGDSVAYYTPITIRVGKYIMIHTIADIAKMYGMDRWKSSGDKEYCELNLIPVDSWTEQGWTPIHRVIRHALAPHKQMIRITTNTAMVDVTDDHSLLTKMGEPISPKDIQLSTQLLHHDVIMKPIGEDAEFVSENIMKLKNPHFMTEGSYTFNNQRDTMVEIAEYYFAMHELGYGVEIESNSITNSITLHAYENVYHEPIVSVIQKIEILPYYGNNYVYDLTTDNHHFAAGIGNMIVHNTDSVFFTFNLKDPTKNLEDIRGKRALEITIEIAQDAAKLCTQFLKSPMELSYEKTMMPFILLSKKRYVGMLYETNPNKGKMKYMGLSLKRRDSCDYLKDTYGGILNILMQESQTTGCSNIQQAVEFLDHSLQELIHGKVPMEKLMITKALRGHYKNPQQIAHCVLAERIAQRDPGNKPKPGDRMKFVHVVHKDNKALQGEKIETPEFIIKNRVPIDYSFYITNQLMKPLQQLFGLALEPICTFKKLLPTIRLIKRELSVIEKEYGDSIEIHMKKREKYCSAKVKTLLFQQYLTEIQNQKMGIKSILNYFS